MSHPISREMHGPIADYPYAAAIATAPETVGFVDESPTATTLCRAMGGAVLATSMMTRAEWGVIPVIPFKAHVAMDSGVSLFALAAPWVFGFADNERARNTFLAAGAVGLLASAMTKPEEMPDPRRASPKTKYLRALARMGLEEARR